MQQEVSQYLRQEPQKIKEVLQDFKAQMCQKNEVHNELVCKFYHNKHDMRRNPYDNGFYSQTSAFNYSENKCKKQNCDELKCNECNNDFEFNFHPLNYKTQPCLDLQCSKIPQEYCHGVHQGEKKRIVKELHLKNRGEEFGSGQQDESMMIPYFPFQQLHQQPQQPMFQNPINQLTTQMNSMNINQQQQQQKQNNHGSFQQFMRPNEMFMQQQQQPHTTNNNFKMQHHHQKQQQQNGIKSFQQKTSSVFNLETFKTKQCQIQSQNHGLKHCIYYHNENDRRRSPAQYTYSSDLCPNYKKCSEGDNCQYAHNKIEQLYHEQRYKSKFCHFYNNNIEKCEYQDICCYAHNENEISINLIDKIPHDETFYVYFYKTIWCPWTKKHDRGSCVYAHNVQDYRRSPQFYQLLPEECPNWSKSPNINLYKDGGCPDNRNCRKCHGWKEYEYHPEIYKTKQCSNQGKCKKQDCAYHHGNDRNERLKQEYYQKKFLMGNQMNPQPEKGQPLNVFNDKQFTQQTVRMMNQQSQFNQNSFNAYFPEKTFIEDSCHMPPRFSYQTRDSSLDSGGQSSSNLSTNTPNHPIQNYQKIVFHSDDDSTKKRTMNVQSKNFYVPNQPIDLPQTRKQREFNQKCSKQYVQAQEYYSDHGTKTSPTSPAEFQPYYYYDNKNINMNLNNNNNNTFHSQKEAKLQKIFQKYNAKMLYQKLRNQYGVDQIQQLTNQDLLKMDIFNPEQMDQMTHIFEEIKVDKDDEDLLNWTVPTQNYLNTQQNNIFNLQDTDPFKLNFQQNSHFN